MSFWERRPNGLSVEQLSAVMAAVERCRHEPDRVSEVALDLGVPEASWRAFLHTAGGAPDDAGNLKGTAGALIAQRPPDRPPQRRTVSRSLAASVLEKTRRLLVVLVDLQRTLPGSKLESDFLVGLARAVERRDLETIGALTTLVASTRTALEAMASAGPDADLAGGVSPDAMAAISERKRLRGLLAEFIESQLDDAQRREAWVQAAEQAHALTVASEAAISERKRLRGLLIEYFEAQPGDAGLFKTFAQAVAAAFAPPELAPRVALDVAGDGTAADSESHWLSQSIAGPFEAEPNGEHLPKDESRGLDLPPGNETLRVSTGPAPMAGGDWKRRFLPLDLGTDTKTGYRRASSAASAPLDQGQAAATDEILFAVITQTPPEPERQPLLSSAVPAIRGAEMATTSPPPSLDIRWQLDRGLANLGGRPLNRSQSTVADVLWSLSEDASLGHRPPVEADPERPEVRETTPTAQSAFESERTNLINRLKKMVALTFRRLTERPSVSPRIRKQPSSPLDALSDLMNRNDVRERPEVGLQLMAELLANPLQLPWESALRIANARSRFLRYHDRTEPAGVPDLIVTHEQRDHGVVINYSSRQQPLSPQFRDLYESQSLPGRVSFVLGLVGYADQMHASSLAVQRPVMVDQMNRREQELHEQLLADFGRNDER